MKQHVAEQIINNLQAKGESKEFIIGYVTAIASSLTEMSLEESEAFIKKTIRLTEQGNLLINKKRNE